MGASSDHMPVRMDLAILTSVNKPDRSHQGEEKTRIDRWLFHEEGVKEAFAGAFVRRLTTLEDEGGLNAYERAAKALKAAAQDTIATTDPPKAGWFRHRSEKLFKAIEVRDQRQLEYNRGKNPKKHAALVKARRLVKETVRAAISDWHEEILLECHSLGAKKGSPRGGSRGWSSSLAEESMGDDSSPSKGTVEHAKARAHETNEARRGTSIVASGKCGGVETLP